MLGKVGLRRSQARVHNVLWSCRNCRPFHNIPCRGPEAARRKIVGETAHSTQNPRVLSDGNAHGTEHRHTHPESMAALDAHPTVHRGTLQRVASCSRVAFVAPAHRSCLRHRVRSSHRGSPMHNLVRAQGQRLHQLRPQVHSMLSMRTRLRSSLLQACPQKLNFDRSSRHPQAPRDSRMLRAARPRSCRCLARSSPRCNHRRE